MADTINRITVAYDAEMEIPFLVQETPKSNVFHANTHMILTRKVFENFGLTFKTAKHFLKNHFIKEIVTIQLLGRDVYFRIPGGGLYAIDVLPVTDALRIVSGRRSEQGRERSFNKIASMWSSYLETEISPSDVAMMMTLLKIVRVKGGSSVSDSIVDIHGYSLLAELLMEGK